MPCVVRDAAERVRRLLTMTLVEVFKPSSS